MVLALKNARGAFPLENAPLFIYFSVYCKSCIILQQFRENIMIHKEK